MNIDHLKEEIATSDEKGICKCYPDYCQCFVRGMMEIILYTIGICDDYEQSGLLIVPSELKARINGMLEKVDQ